LEIWSTFVSNIPVRLCKLGTTTQS